MIPTNAKLLECMKFTFETIVMPSVNGDYEKSQSKTLLNLFDYCRHLSQEEGAMLWQEKARLLQLLQEVAGYLATLPADNSLQAIIAEMNKPLAEPVDGYPSNDYLNQTVLCLKQRLDDALAYLVSFSAERKADEKYQAIRHSIRCYLVESLQRDDDLMQRSFTTKRR